MILQTQTSMINLIGHSIPKPISAKYGFYWLFRVKQHVLFDEPADDGWDAAMMALNKIWQQFEVRP